jgi:hypothetical protein
VGGPTGGIPGRDACGFDCGFGRAVGGGPAGGIAGRLGGWAGGIPDRLGAWVGDGWVVGGIAGRLGDWADDGVAAGRTGSAYIVGGSAGCAGGCGGCALGWAGGEPTGLCSPPRRPPRGGSGCWSSRIGSSLPLSERTRSMMVCGALFSSSSARRRRRRGASPFPPPYSASSSATVRCARSEPLSRLIVSTVPRAVPSVQ